MAAQFSATLTSFHTASPEKDPYTIYVITVKKGASQWQVFRRYREWEDLRAELQQQTGSAPQMPRKMLFGRMRPEVIESRVVGLDNFLQLCMVTPLYASCPDLADFLTRGKNQPPEGLDLTDLGDSKFDSQATGEADGSPYGQHQAQLKQLVESASQVPPPPPPLLPRPACAPRTRPLRSSWARLQARVPPPLAPPPLTAAAAAVTAAAAVRRAGLHLRVDGGAAARAGVRARAHARLRRRHAGEHRARRRQHRAAARGRRRARRGRHRRCDGEARGDAAAQRGRRQAAAQDRRRRRRRELRRAGQARGRAQQAALSGPLCLTRGSVRRLVAKDLF